MRTPQRRLLRAGQLTGALFLAAFSLAGCEPSCESTCEKLLACDDVETPLVSQTDCESSCSSQEILYESWEDEDKRQALADYKTCVSDETCSAIAEGACYDEAIYGWSATETAE